MSFLSSRENSQVLKSGRNAHEFYDDQNQNQNPNRMTIGSQDDSRLMIDRKYQLHERDDGQSNDSQDEGSNNCEAYFGVGYGLSGNELPQDDNEYSSPDFVKKGSSPQKLALISNNRPQYLTPGNREGISRVHNQIINQETQQNEESFEEDDGLSRQRMSQGQMIELFRQSKKSISNQWALQGAHQQYLTSTNIYDENAHQDYLNGETLTSHHMRNPTNMKSQGNYLASRPDSNLALATQRANGTVSAGGFDHDIEFEETDFKYLEEVILKVKEGTDQQFHLSDYLEAMLQELQIEQTSEWDEIIGESKEIQKTLKKVLDISFFLLERTQLQSNENRNLQLLNSQLFKELQQTQDHCKSLNVDLKGCRNKIKQQYEAIKTQEENIKSLQEQLGAQLDIIKRLEKSSILSNAQSFGYQNITAGLMNPDQQEIINQQNKKINELESYLADQTSNYHSEVFKNERLMSKIKEFQRNEEVLSIQILQLETFKEEKDDKIFRLKEKKRLLREELIRKEVEVKNLVRIREQSQATATLRPGIIQLNRLDQSHLNITQNDADQFNQSYSTNIHDTTIIRHQRKGINIMGSQQKWSHELDVAVNKLRESKSGFMQRSFIMHQNMQDIQMAHHKRMQTISSNELMNSHSEFNQISRDNMMKSPLKAKLNQSIVPKSNKILAQSQNMLFNNDDSTTEIQKMNYLSPEYKSSAKKTNMSRFEQSEESKFDINDHISPRKSNVYSNFNEEEDEDDIRERYDQVVELNPTANVGVNRGYNIQINQQASKQSSYFKATPGMAIGGQHAREISKASNLIGINESDLMEFNTSANRIGATLVNQSHMDYSAFGGMEESQRSILKPADIHLNNDKDINLKQKSNQRQGNLNQNQKQMGQFDGVGTNQDQKLTVNNINITKNIGVNNFLGEGQFVQSFQGSIMQENSSHRLSSNKQQTNRNQTTQSTTAQRKPQSKEDASSKVQASNDNKISLQSYGSVNRNGVKSSQKMVFEMPSSNQKLRISPSKKVNFSNMEDEDEEEKKSPAKRGILKVGDRSTLKNNYNELNCITVDQEDIESEQIIYQISNIDPEEKSQILQDLTSNNIRLEEQISRLVMQKDILIEYFVISVLAFILKHPKRTSLQQIDKIKLYNEAQSKSVPFFKWHKWIEMRMIEIYHEKKRQKKAELRKTLFDPKSWFGKIKVNNDKSKIEIIEDHFQTI